MSKGNNKGKGHGRAPGSEWFKAVTYTWINEVLHVGEEEFDTLKEAVEHLISSKCNSGKVYTHRGWMVHRHHGSHGKGHHNHGPYC